MPDNIFNLTDLTRELAAMYAEGLLTIDEYLISWERIMRAHIEGQNLNTVAV